MRFVWMGVLAACRLNFDRVAHDPDAAVVSDEAAVDLRVVTDEYGSDQRGLPIAGATVLVDRGHGLERSVTDATGSARVTLEDLVALHVVFHGELGWRVYTVVDPLPGPLELGGRVATQAGRRMSFTFADNGSANYTLRFAEHCGIPAGTNGIQLDTEISAACDGKLQHTIAFATRPGAPRAQYLDAGPIPLAAGARYTFTGAYRDLTRYDFSFIRLGPLATRVGVQILERTGLDLLPLTDLFGNDVAITAGKAALPAFAAPGGNAIMVQLINSAPPIQYLASSETIQPWAAVPATERDAAQLLLPFVSLDLDRPPSLAWTGAPGGTITIIETITGTVQWDAYLPPGATSVDFPALPADLGVKMPIAFDFASAMKLDVPGATRASLLPTIDRTWPQWPHDATLLPDAGGTLSRILYSAGLGPP